MNSITEKRSIQVFPKDIKAVVGLGNPGREFTNTYHNVGAEALSFMLEELSNEKLTLHSSRLFKYKKIRGVTFAIPRTFMNESGRAAAALLASLHLRPENLLVLHDDADILLGSFKYAFGRGAAGHRGVLSLIHALRTKNFGRVRIGIRKKAGKAGGFVLRRISAADRKRLQSVFSSLTPKLMEKESF